jgi:hypothetical protein
MVTFLSGLGLAKVAPAPVASTAAPPPISPFRTDRRVRPVASPLVKSSNFGPSMSVSPVAEYERTPDGGTARPAPLHLEFLGTGQLPRLSKSLQSVWGSVVGMAYAKRYRFRCKGGKVFSLEPWQPGGEVEYQFNALVETDGGTSVVMDIAANSGPHLVDISTNTTAPWTVTFKPQ